MNIRSLPQGLRIEHDGGIHYQTAEWVVLVTLDSPPPTKHAFHFASVLQEKVNKVSDQFPQLTQSWNVRITWCKQFLSQYSVEKGKRAPLGFIGQLSHTLFGTITEEELNQYKSILWENNLALNQTVHRVNALLSATKQIQININANSAHLFKLQRYLASISRTISISFLQAKRAIEHIELKFKIEHALISLEQTTHHIASYYNRRKRQFNSMYHRSLSEDVLPLSQLKEVLRQATGKGFSSMPPQWYYRNCNIAPLWTTINSITFRVHLHLHDGKTYLLHTFTSLLYPIKQGFKAILQVRRKIAYSSSSGSLFEPMLCTGTKDRICRGGPLFRAANFRCERALLSGDRSAHGKCATKLFPSNSTVIEEKTAGFYTVSTFAMEAKLHCDSEREKNINLEAGVYLISLNHSCTLRNSEWTLPGLNRFKTPPPYQNPARPPQFGPSLRTILPRATPENSTSTPVDSNSETTSPCCRTHTRNTSVVFPYRSKLGLTLHQSYSSFS